MTEHTDDLDDGIQETEASEETTAESEAECNCECTCIHDTYLE